MRAALIAFALVAAPAIAQAPAPVTGRAAVKAGTYQVDSAHSQVVFTLMHLGVSEYTGQFTNPTGSLTIDPANPAAAKVDITFPIDKISTTVAPLDAHLKSPDFFDAAKFPTGHFVSTSVKVNGDRATITGNLTLKDVTKPVTLDARFVGAGDMRGKTNVGFAATTTIKRSDWGIKYGVPMVGDDVKLTINVAFAM